MFLFYYVFPFFRIYIHEGFYLKEVGLKYATDDSTGRIRNTRSHFVPRVLLRLEYVQYSTVKETVQNFNSRFNAWRFIRAHL